MCVFINIASGIIAKDLLMARDDWLSALLDFLKHNSIQLQVRNVVKNVLGYYSPRVSSFGHIFLSDVWYSLGLCSTIIIRTTFPS